MNNQRRIEQLEGIIIDRTSIDSFCNSKTNKKLMKAHYLLAILYSREGNQIESHANFREAGYEFLNVCRERTQELGEFRRSRRLRKQIEKRLESYKAKLFGIAGEIDYDYDATSLLLAQTIINSRKKDHYKAMIGIIGISTMVGAFIAGFVDQNNFNKSIPNYVENNIERIIENQEEKLGIKHFGFLKISFEQPYRAKDKLGIYTKEGEYFYNQDRINIPMGLTFTPDINLLNIMETFNFNSIDDVKKMLEHELGHFYADKLNESLGRGNYPNYPNPSELGTRLISEGIAEYFERTMNNGQDEFKDSDWPEKLEDFYTINVLYDGGFHLVKPILDKYKKDGIEYLICNPPSIQDLSNPQSYQKRVMHSLSNQPKR